MFKNFHGFQLVDEYHLWKKEHRQNNNPLQIKIIKLTLAIAATLFCWVVPTSFFNITGLTVVEQRIIAVFVFAALRWLFDAVPAWTTSLVVVLLLFCASDSSLWFMRESETLGKLVSYKAILHCFADPIIMLFIGGFIIAIAASKSGLDVKLAKALLTPFGTKSENVMLGFLLVSGVSQRS